MILSLCQYLNDLCYNAALAFEPAKVLSEYQEQINRLQEQNDELAKALGKITVERNHTHQVKV